MVVMDFEFFIYLCIFPSQTNIYLSYLKQQMDKSAQILHQPQIPAANQPNLNADKPKSVVQSKKNYQIVWKIIFAIISIGAAVLLKKLYLYQTLPLFEEIRKGNIYELMFFGLLIAVAYNFIDKYIHKYGDPFFFKYYINEEKFPNPQDRLKRCYTLVKWAYQNVYYIIFSVWSYAIIRQTSFCPTWLGGNGSPLNIINYIYSFDEATLQMKAFYIIQFGKHLNRFITHVFIRPEGNFYEYALHHGLSTFLIFFSYLSNMWLIGIFVLFVHDLSDIFLSFARGYREYKNLNRVVINIFYFLAIVTWIGCRIFIFSMCCVYSASYIAYLCWKTDILTPQFSEVLLLPYGFMAFMLAALQVLHLFWTYYIGSSFLSVSVTAKVKHTYD